jgi:chloride channel 7
MYVDLRPYLNPTPHTVHVHMPLATAFTEFTQLALRHMVVVNDCHDVVGIITRHDLLESSVRSCAAEKSERLAAHSVDDP